MLLILSIICPSSRVWLHRVHLKHVTHSSRVTRCTFHNLQETGAFYLRLFCCPESILYWKEGRKTSAWMKVPIAQSHLIPVAFDHGFIYHHAVSDYAMLLKWLPQFEESRVPPFATHQVGVAGITFTLSYFFKAIKSTGAIGSSKFGIPYISAWNSSDHKHISHSLGISMGLGHLWRLTVKKIYTVPF